jgi:glyceraldehyde 3-phosphate dehydrogenase
MRGDPHRPVFGAVDSVALDDMVKCVAWYDDERGYACRTADMCGSMARRGM